MKTNQNSAFRAVSVAAASTMLLVTGAFASVSSSQVQVRRYTKGAAGPLVTVRSDSSEARRVSREVNTASSTQSVPVAANTFAAPCRPFEVRSTKGAKSYVALKSGRLIRCAGADGKKDKGAVHCTADLPCANGPRCTIKMTCLS